MSLRLIFCADKIYFHACPFTAGVYAGCFLINILSSPCKEGQKGGFL